MTSAFCSGVGCGVPAITIYGAEDDLEGLTDTEEVSTGHSVAYRPIRGMAWRPGSSAFGCATHKGIVYIGALTASTNSLNYSYIDSTFHAFNPNTNRWTVIPVETDLGFTGASGVVFDGFTVCDIPALIVTAGKVVALAVWDYNGWEIAEWGRYPAWIELAGTTIDYANSYTIDELRAMADVDGALSFPDQTNTFAETYAGNRGMAAVTRLPNGWLAVVDYFALTAVGIYSGRLKVFDTNGIQRVFYQWPNMQTEDGVLLQWAPKFISVDPSSTDPTDYRVIVNGDVLLRGTSTAAPFMVQEMAIDTVGQTITPVCAPVGSVSRDQTVLWSDYTGQNTARPIFSADGTCWVSSSTRGTFNARAMGVWFKSGGERRWAAENPPTAGWENHLGLNRVVPDCELGVLEQTSALHSGEYIDPVSGGHIVVGSGGGLFPFIPDRPLVYRTELLTNPSLAANITGWGPFGASGTTIWEATDGGRGKFTGNGSAANGVWQAPAGLGFIDLPADSEGQSIWAWARFKPNSTARSVQVQVSFYDDADVQVDSTVGPTIFEVPGSYVQATCPSAVPVGAVKFRIFCRVLLGGANGEIHYWDSGSTMMAPVTHKPTANLDLALLPRLPGNFRWPAGSSSRDAVDAKRFGWCPITVLGSAEAPESTPQYLARLNLPEILGVPWGYRPRASLRKKGPTNPLRYAA